MKGWQDMQNLWRAGFRFGRLLVPLMCLPLTACFYSEKSILVSHDDEYLLRPGKYAWVERVEDANFAEMSGPDAKKRACSQRHLPYARSPLSWWCRDEKAITVTIERSDRGYDFKSSDGLTIPVIASEARTDLYYEFVDYISSIEEPDGYDDAVDETLGVYILETVNAKDQQRPIYNFAFAYRGHDDLKWEEAKKADYKKFLSDANQGKFEIVYLWFGKCSGQACRVERRSTLDTYANGIEKTLVHEINGELSSGILRPDAMLERIP